MATVSYDSRSFLIDGKRVWLASGAIHYFRTPARLWHDRLLKAKRGGLNCIETYVAWNFHEPIEGQWDFSGDRDIVEFIHKAHDLGLYVIVRPGPYICAEWDFGGFPGWLAGKSGVQYRLNNAVYMHYFDKYLRQLLPRVVDLQVSRGGNIIAIQNENEYYWTTQPDRTEYLNFITQQYRRAGIDIPILTCNLLTEPLTDGAVECNNSFDRGVENLKKLRAMQPDAPLLTTEYWPGWFDWWGAEHHTRDDRTCTRKALELMGAGSQVNYYMYHGGTNFGFYGGRNVHSDDCFMTTSYDYDAPLAEGGGLTRKYYLMRLVNMFASCLGEVPAAAAPLEGAAATAGVGVLSQAGPAGRVIVVTNNGDDSITEATIALHDGRSLDVDLSHFGAVGLISDAHLTDKHLLNECNLMPLGLFEQKLLVLHGRAGQTGRWRVNGQAFSAEVPAGDAVEQLDCQGLAVLVINSALAERCWSVERSLVLGPDFVGETLDEIEPHKGARQMQVVELGETIRMDTQKTPSPARDPQPPKLTTWKAVHTCPEPVDAELEWKKLDRVRPLEALDVPLGYGWYQVTVKLPRAAKKSLFLPQADDRVTIWANGQRIGVWGRGPEATRTPIDVPLVKGENVLTFLADNMGRFCFGFNLGEPKGIYGDIHAGAPLRLKAWKTREGSAEDWSKRMLDRNQACLEAEFESKPLQVSETSFTLTKAMPVHVQYPRIGRPSILICNDRPVGVFPGQNAAFGDAFIPSGTKKGANRLRLLSWGPPMTAKDLSVVSVHRMEENLTAGCKWRFRPWTLPGGESASRSRELPTWFQTTFAKPAPTQTPLFLHILGAAKGQMYLNGRNLGRYWTVGPQQDYYVPVAWLEEQNELLLFDEAGQTPSRTRLEFKPLGPYRTE